MRQPARATHSRSAQDQRAACPGLLQRVAAVDGGLCRIKLAGGRLSAGQARAIAGVARDCAGDVLEITNRANLQLRGIRPGQGDAVAAVLTQAGLGPLPATDAATCQYRDQRRNLMISPLAGIDPQQRLDTQALAAALLLAIQRDARLDGLSPKFAILLDGGEQLADLGHPHDLWLSASEAGGPSPRLLLGLACAPLDASASDCPGHIDPADAVDTVIALILAFLELAAPDMSRLRELLARQGPAPLLQRAAQLGARIQPLPAGTAIAFPAPAIEPALNPRRLGVQPQRQPGLCQVGFQAPLARLDARMLEGLAAVAEQYGDHQLRLTPWQGGLLANIPAAQASACLQALQALGLICDPAPPIARLLACAGRRGCARAHADTKADARWLAGQPLPAASIHLSGCPRSCAAASTAGFTLLAVADDRYDLYQRGDGHLPERCLGRQLTLQQAAALLQARGTERPYV